jgi:hypothetical protein
MPIEFAATYTDDADTESIEKQRWEGGFEFVAQLDWPITEDIQFQVESDDFHGRRTLFDRHQLR